LESNQSIVFSVRKAHVCHKGASGFDVVFFDASYFGIMRVLTWSFFLKNVQLVIIHLFLSDQHLLAPVNNEVPAVVMLALSHFRVGGDDGLQVTKLRSQHDRDFAQCAIFEMGLFFRCFYRNIDKYGRRVRQISQSSVVRVDETLHTIGFGMIRFVVPYI
jgi:hypothetical protein